jgi:signal transduction histidine kinase
MREGGWPVPVAQWRPAVVARRVGAAPHALAVTGAVLAVASVAQASAQSVALAGARGSVGHPGTASVALYAVPLCLLALATTVPLSFLHPLPAAMCITVASVLSLAAFGLVTVGGVIAQVIAVYWLGAAGPDETAGSSREPVWHAGVRYLAPGLGAPFLVLALASRGGMAAVLLASAVPAAAATGITLRSRRSASLEGAARSELAETLVEHMARGERARIARELHDVVAHHISVISVQAETARLTVPNLTPEGARRLREIGDTARAGLTEMRRLLGVLRSDVDSAAGDERQPQPGLLQLTSLIDDSRAERGGGVRLIVSGPVAPFDPGVELAAYASCRRHSRTPGGTRRAPRWTSNCAMNRPCCGFASGTTGRDRAPGPAQLARRRRAAGSSSRRTCRRNRSPARDRGRHRNRDPDQHRGGRRP